jgi:hypothetical protein
VSEKPTDLLAGKNALRRADFPERTTATDGGSCRCDLSAATGAFRGVLAEADAAIGVGCLDLPAAKHVVLRQSDGH